jgi:repressor LexA
MNELTPRQAEVLELIRQVIENTGRPPTRAEISQHLGFSSANAAETHLRALARKGVIELSPGASRGIRLVEVEEPGLPVVGRVAAGTPILAEEHIETRYRMDPEVFQPRAHYLLQVKGMSMKDVGIFEGDLVAVHRATDVRNGQIVVARLDDEVTVKRFRQRGHQIWLLPENEEFEPIEVDLTTQNLVLEGVVVGVIRNGRIQ